MRTVSLLAAVAAIVLAVAFPARLESATPEKFASDRVIVRFKPGVDAARANGLREELRAEVSRRLKLVDAEVWTISGMTVEEAIEKFRRDPRVDYIEPDYVLSAADVFPNDPFFDELWGLHNTGQNGGIPDADIDAPSAWESVTGSDIVIGLLDSGVDYLHPDLAANMWTNAGEIANNGVDDDLNGYVDDVRGWDFVDDDSDPMDGGGHGTHCAGTMAAVGNNGIGVAGVCWRARIMPLRFLDQTGFGFASDAALALEYALMNGARVANCSWGTYSYSVTLRDAIAACGEAGTLLVASAGNDGINLDGFPYYPACYDLDNIISVAATDLDDTRADFSNVGATSIDLGAPGMYIYSTEPDGAYDYRDGTSSSAAHVAGAAGLVWSKVPACPAPIIKSAIMLSVDPLPSLAGFTVTGGRLNVGRALAGLDTLPPALVSDLAIVAPGSNTMRLAWTAPGDDGLSGSASTYDVRYALVPIDSASFDLAAQATGEPFPSAAGSADSFTVRGLECTTTYYFALRALDDRGNRSGVSNCVSGTTLVPPAIAASPGSFADSLSNGQTSVHPLTIRNTAGGTLDYSIEVERIAPYGVSALDTGLRDLEGVDIRYDASHGEYGMTEYYSAIVDDLRARGANVVSSADSIVPGSLDTYDVLFVTDGAAAAPWTADEIAVLAPWVTAGGGLLIAGDSRIESYNAILGALAAGIEYAAVTTGYGSTSRIYAHPITEGVASLYLSHAISRLAAATPATRRLADDSVGMPVAAVGLSGVGRVVAIAHDMLRVDCIDAGDNRLFGNRAFDWLAAGACWLTTAPASGTVAAGESIAVAVTLDARLLYGGEYRSIVRILSNDPALPDMELPANLHVTAIPDIALSDTAIDFGRIWAGGVGRDTIVVSNQGPDSLFVSGVSVNDPRFDVDTTAFALGLYGERRLIVACAPLEPGTVTGTLSIASNDPDEPVMNVTLRFECVYPPAVAAAPDSMLVQLSTGGIVVREIEIANTGGDTLVYVTREGSAGAAPIAYPDLDLLIIYSANYPPPEIRDSLLALPGIGSVDFFDGGAGPPSLGTLLAYDCVMLSNLYVFNGEVELGDVLADYVDRGGGVIMTQGSFVGIYSVEGRFWNDGYCPFARAGSYSSSSNLGAYDVNHPVMAGVTSAHTSSAAIVTLTAESRLVASWMSGIPFVATKGEHVVGMTISLMSRSNWSGNVPLILRNAARWASGGGAICWADAEPQSGSVAPGDTARVAMTFRSTSLCAPYGTFEDSLLVASNDPARGSVPVRLRLVIEGDPDIHVATSDIDFGSVLVGDTAIAHLGVANYGVDSLHISSVTTDGTAFMAAPDSFVVPVNASRSVSIAFAPTAEGTIAGSMTIASDDPDEPSLVVSLHGLAITPGEISVVPDSLNAVLAQGDSVTRILTIANGGASDLVWEIHPLTGTAMAAYVLPAVAAFEASSPENEGSVSATVAEAAMNQGELAAALADLDGVRVLFDYSHREYSITWEYRTIIGDLTARGATVRENRAPIASDVLAGCEVFWITDQRDSLMASEILALRDWIEAGGALLLEGDQSAFTWNALLASLGAGIEYSATAGTNGVTTQIVPHATTWDVSSLSVIKSWGHLSLTAWPSRLLANDAGGAHLAACSAAGRGRIVAVAEELFYYDCIVGGNNRLFGNQVFDWLAAGASWLSAAPHAGTTAAGDTSLVEVAIAPRGLLGGGHDAVLRVESNDPSTRVLSVPVHLDFTGAPELIVSSDTLDFGPTIIGAVVTLPLVVTNEGYDSLGVSAVVVAGERYAAPPEGFALPAHGSRTLLVAFNPMEVDPVFGTLTIYSDDPTNGARTIALTGSGLVPPEIRVTPGALADTLFVGRSASQTLTIENDGEHELLFTLVEKGQGNRYLIVHGGNDMSAIRAALLAYEDMVAVDVFDASAGTPTLELLDGYDCAIVATGGPLANATALGDALAAYADRGGSVVLAFPSYVSGFEVQGGFASGGYSPFTFGGSIATNATLGTYDFAHPIMAGVASATSPLYGATTLAAGAQWVASWANGTPFVATMGERVAGVNMSIMNLGAWPGSNAENVARLVHNAAYWASGGSICWAAEEPTAGAVPPHSSTTVTVTFRVGLPLCVTEGSYVDTLLVESNVPSSPRIAVPLHLFVTPLPDTIAPFVLVVSPNGGETMQSGENREIHWIANDDRGVSTVDVYVSFNGGVDYELLAAGVPNDSLYEWVVPPRSSDSCLARVVAFDASGLSGADGSDGMFSIVDVTGVGDETLPAATRLAQNYPNPLNPTTRIDFSLREPGRVSLAVYDAAGRLVRTVLDEPLQAGRHSAMWDGRDARGALAASGIYFCRMKCGAFEATRKMVLLR